MGKRVLISLKTKFVFLFPVFILIFWKIVCVRERGASPEGSKWEFHFIWIIPHRTLWILLRKHVLTMNKFLSLRFASKSCPSFISSSLSGMDDSLSVSPAGSYANLMKKSVSSFWSHSCCHSLSRIYNFQLTVCVDFELKYNAPVELKLWTMR